MIRAKNSFYFLFAIFFYSTAFCQNPAKIKVRKFNNDFYFFQKGEASDTIGKGKRDIFYLKIASDKACNTRIEIENGALLKSGNDSIFTLKHMVHLNYLHTFEDSMIVVEKKRGDATVHDKQLVSKCGAYKVLINGSNTSADPGVIKISFINTADDKVYLTNTFYYR